MRVCERESERERERETEREREREREREPINFVLCSIVGAQLLAHDDE